MIVKHIQENWSCHLAAASGFAVSVSLGSVLESIMVGVTVFVLTNTIKFVWSKIWKK